MTDWSDEEIDLALLEAACAQAEQSYAAKASGGVHPAAAAPRAEPVDEVPQPLATTGSKRKLPSSLTGGGAENTVPNGGGGPGKRKLPASLTGPGAAPQQLPLLRYEGPCQYLYTAVEVDGLCELLCSSGLRYCGFDIEWRVTYETGVAPRPVALVQLCLPQPGPQPYRCLLLHIARTGVTPNLCTLLCSKDILKVGVGAHGDALKMQRDFGFEMAGVLDLNEFANMRLCGEGQPPQKWSLAGLVERLMGRTLAKTQQLRCSDWERQPLTAEQREYAAADVFASLSVYELLERMPVVWQPAAPLPAPQLALGEGGTALTAGLIPACSELARLQPAKFQVYVMHMQEGLSAQEIAAARHMQEDSVQGYLAEAITGGYAYCWGLLAVPEATLQRVAEVAGGLLGCQLSCEPTQAVTAATQKAQDPQQLQPCEEAAAAGGEGRGSRPVDVLQALLATGAKIRELKEGHFPDVSYGHLRLSLAHLGRCNPGLCNPGTEAQPGHACA